jgi:hypothetical protein
VNKQIVFISGLILFFSLANECLNDTLIATVENEVNFETDSIQKQISIKVRKIYPIQILFCEIPTFFAVSHEQKKSTQFKPVFIFLISEESKLGSYLVQQDNQLQIT